MNSVETAAKAGRIKIQSINDFTTENVEIEIKLARGVYADETVSALFAFTECEQSISVNLLVIKDNFPRVMTITEVIQHHAKQLVKVLIQELELEKRELQDKLHLRTLERIFIEERIYKAIEKMKTSDGVTKAVIEGFKPFTKEVGPRGISPSDVEHLLKIPIRRISLFDINKARAEMQEIQARIKEINGHLKNITAYALGFLDSLLGKIKKNEEFGFGGLPPGARRTEVGAFAKVNVKEIVKKDLELKYDQATGYLGTGVTGEILAEVSPFSRILTLKKNGTWFVGDLAEKTFVGPGAWWIGVADKEVLSRIIFTVIYKEETTSYPCIKRCIIEGWIMNKEYSLVPEGAEVLHVDTRQKFTFTVKYTPKARIKITAETFKAQDYLVKGLKAGGVRLAAREVSEVEVKKGTGKKDEQPEDTADKT
jgi:topoisomerase-4 subunit A